MNPASAYELGRASAAVEFVAASTVVWLFGLSFFLVVAFVWLALLNREVARLSAAAPEHCKEGERGEREKRER